MIRSTFAAPPASVRVPSFPTASEKRPAMGDPRSFGTTLAAASDSETTVTPRADARASAETLVAQTFIAPLLAQLRETNKAAGPFGVSEAEKRLGPVFDERIATQVVRQARFPIVDQVEASLLRSQAAADAAKESRP